LGAGASGNNGAATGSNGAATGDDDDDDGVDDDGASRRSGRSATTYANTAAAAAVRLRSGLGDPSLAFRAPLAGGGADSVQEGGRADSSWADARARVAGHGPWGIIGIEEWR
jgi:hypothetical protein